MAYGPFNFYVIRLDSSKRCPSHSTRLFGKTLSCVFLSIFGFCLDHIMNIYSCAYVDTVNTRGRYLISIRDVSGGEELTQGGA